MTTPPKRPPNWNRWTPDPHDPLQVLQRILKDKRNRRDRERKNKKNEENQSALSEPSSSSVPSVEDQVRELDAVRDWEEAIAFSPPPSASSSTTDPPAVYLGMVSDDVFKVVDKTQTYEGKHMLVFSVSAYQKHLWDFGKKMIKIYKSMKKDKRAKKKQAKLEAKDPRETG